MAVTGYVACLVFARTSSLVLHKNPAASANDIPCASESYRKNKSAFAYGSPKWLSITPACSWPEPNDVTTTGVAWRFLLVPFIRWKWARNS
jgi:hypothetical protein